MVELCCPRARQGKARARQGSQGRFPSIPASSHVNYIHVILGKLPNTEPPELLPKPTISFVRFRFRTLTTFNRPETTVKLRKASANLKHEPVRNSLTFDCHFQSIFFHPLDRTSHHYGPRCHHPGTKKLLDVHEVDTYKPGPYELLVKNEVVAFNPVEFKVIVGEGISED